MQNHAKSKSIIRLSQLKLIITQKLKTFEALIGSFFCATPQLNARLEEKNKTVSSKNHFLTIDFCQNSILNIFSKSGF